MGKLLLHPLILPTLEAKCKFNEHVLSSLDGLQMAAALAIVQAKRGLYT